METNLIGELALERGSEKSIDPFWIMRTLLARSVKERRGFAQVVNLSLSS